jgi:hypothetical protein
MKKKGGEIQVKKRVVILAVMLSMGCVGWLSGAAFAENKGPETITIDHNHKKKKVEGFKHHKHQESMDCKTCHHKKEDGKDPHACASCHADPAQEIHFKTGKKAGKKMKLKDAYHTRCLDGCHKKKENKGKAPTKCKGCHGA